MTMTREALIRLVQDLMDMNIPEDQEEQVFATLEQETSDPDITDYIYYSDPPMSADDVVDLALGLRKVNWTRFGAT